MAAIFHIRAAEDSDADMALLAKYCHALAAFDNHQANLDAPKLKQRLFGVETNVRAFLAFLRDEPIGFILVYESFSVYHGERGLYVPGAYIIDKYRHHGYGVRLFAHVAEYAAKNNFDFINGIVEDNNEKANALYRKMGASVSAGWSYVRIPKAVFEKLTMRFKK